MKKAYYIYWLNTQNSKTGTVTKITVSEQRAIELFYKEYTEDYKILNIHN